MIRLLRHGQPVHREEDGMEQYDSMTLVLCNGQLAIGYPLWQGEEDKRNGFNIA